MTVHRRRRRTSVLGLTLGSGGPLHTETVLGAVIAMCGSVTVSSGGLVMRGAAGFVGNQLTMVRGRLNNMRSGVMDFGGRGRVVSLRSTMKRCADRSRGCDSSIVRARARLRMTHCVGSCLASGSGRGSLVPTGAKVDSVGVRDRVSRCGRAGLGQSRLLSRDDRHGPVMRRLGSSVGTVERDVVDTVSGVVMDLGIQLGRTRGQRGTTRDGIRAVPAGRQRVLSVRHRRGVGRDLCLFLLGGHRRGTLSRTVIGSGT